MKVLFLVVWLGSIGLTIQAGDCGYTGESRSSIESKLDDCFLKNVVSNRAKMTIGFELCFGFEYEHLNATVAAPLESKLKELDGKMLNLAEQYCYIEDREDMRPLRPDGKFDFKLENELEFGCKHFFDVLIQAMYNDFTAVESIYNANIALIKDVVYAKDIEVIKNKVLNLIDQLDGCKEKEVRVRGIMIQKYLEKYVMAMMNPKEPAFNAENIDVLLNPELYTVEKGMFSEPDFGVKVTSEQTVTSTKNPYRRKKVVMESRQFKYHSKREKQKIKKWFKDLNEMTTEEREKLKLEEEKRAKKKNYDDEDLWQMTPNELLAAGELDEQKYNDTIDKNENHSHPLYSPQIPIDDIWNEKLIIRNKRLNDEDAFRYKIKGFDIDADIEKMFGTD